MATASLVAGLAGFAWTCLVIELTPGPNMSTLAMISALRGRAAGVAAVAGVALGLLVIGLLAALGLAALIERSPFLYELLRWAGTAYLLWLAWEAWRDSGTEAGGDLALVPPDGVVRYFRFGLITNLLNPKAGIFYVSVLPTFLDPARSLAGQTIALTLLYVAIATGVHLAIVLAAGRFTELIGDPRRSRRIRRIMAVLLAVIAVWLAWSTRR